MIFGSARLQTDMSQLILKSNHDIPQMQSLSKAALILNSNKQLRRPKRKNKGLGKQPFCKCGCGNGIILKAERGENEVSLQMVSDNFYFMQKRGICLLKKN